jgi:hypothetical protein
MTVRWCPTCCSWSRFLDEAKDFLPAAEALRRRLHSKPKLGLDLPPSTAVLEGLRGLGDIGGAGALGLGQPARQRLR